MDPNGDFVFGVMVFISMIVFGAIWFFKMWANQIDEKFKEVDRLYPEAMHIMRDGNDDAKAAVRMAKDLHEVNKRLRDVGVNETRRLSGLQVQVENDRRRIKELETQLETVRAVLIDQGFDFDVKKMEFREVKRRGRKVRRLIY
jgi:hypothetical protein